MRSKQQGVTLIELMIAILIGIFISLMVVQYLVTSSVMFKRQSVDANIEQNAGFAVSYLSKYIRQAGSRDGHGTEVPFFAGDCGSFVPCTAEADGADGTEANSDRVAVQMFLDAGGRDCAGNPASGQIAHVFYIDQEDPASPVNSLFCRGYDVAGNTWFGDGVALIDGIEQMQVIYGIANNSEQIYSYVSADRVPSVGGSTARGWDKIRAVKLALLVSDGNGRETDADPQSYQLFNGPVTPFTDRIARRVISTAVTLNSKIP